MFVEYIIPYKAVKVNKNLLTVIYKYGIIYDVADISLMNFQISGVL